MLNNRKMYLSLCVTIILLLIQSISGSHVEDNQVIIGSSIAGVLSLVSRSFKKNEKYLFMNCRLSLFLILLLFLNYSKLIVVCVGNLFGY